MKSLDQVITKVVRIAYQRKDIMSKLVHLEKMFETHNDRVEANVERYKIDFSLSEQKTYVVAEIFDVDAEKIVETLFV